MEIVTVIDLPPNGHSSGLWGVELSSDVRPTELVAAEQIKLDFQLT